MTLPLTMTPMLPLTLPLILTTTLPLTPGTQPSSWAAAEPGRSQFDPIYLPAHRAQIIREKLSKEEAALSLQKGAAALQLWSGNLRAAVFQVRQPHRTPVTPATPATSVTLVTSVALHHRRHAAPTPFLQGWELSA